MIRIANVTLPDAKPIAIALTAIYGMGRTRSHAILRKAALNPNIRTAKLTEEDAGKLRTIIEKEYKVEGELRHQIRSNIKRLKDTKSYRGIRHEKRLPVRGQNTKTNSRTIRGNVRMTASGTSSKKSAPAAT